MPAEGHLFSERDTNTKLYVFPAICGERATSLRLGNPRVSPSFQYKPSLIARSCERKESNLGMKLVQTLLAALSCDYVLLAYTMLFLLCFFFFYLHWCTTCRSTSVGNNTILISNQCLQPPQVIHQTHVPSYEWKALQCTTIAMWRAGHVPCMQRPHPSLPCSSCWCGMSFLRLGFQMSSELLFRYNT